MASSNIARLGVVLGLDTAAFTADVDKAIAETRNLKAAITRESNAAAKEIVALKYATEDYGKEVSKVVQIEREIAAGRFKNAAPAIQQQLLAQAKAYDDVAAAGKRTMGVLSEQQKLAITYQTTDLVTQIASGQNAMIALLQQGGQLKDQFGGVGNMFKALAAMITPMKVAITGLAAGFGTIALAAYQGASEQSNFRNELLLTGNYANLTYNQFLKLSEVLSSKVNISIGNAKDIFSALVSSGKLTGSALNSVAESIANVSRLSGESAKEVAGKLIPAFTGGASSIRELNERMNFLTFEQYRHIVLLDKQGKSQEAAKIAADAFNAKLKDQETNLGTLQKAWKGLEQAASWAWNAMMGIGREDKGMDRAAVLEKKINQLVANIEANKDILTRNPVEMGKRQKMLDDMRAELATLATQITKDQDKTFDQQKQREKIKQDQLFGDKRRQLDFENNQLMLKNEFALRKQYATEFARIDLETAEQAQLLINETKRKDQEEAGKLAVENGRILSQQLYALDLAAQEKKNDLRKKQEAKIREDQYAFAQEMEQAFTQELVRRSDIVKSITLQTQAERESLEYEMQKLMLKNSLIGASDKVVQLAMLELETQRKIAEINANPDLDPSEKARQAANIRRNQGMQEMFISMQDSLKATQRVYDAVFGNMEKALENFVRTGKLSFKDLARSIIQDLILIQLKASATMLFNSFLRSMGFSFGSASGGTITGGSGLIPRAYGGSVNAGTSYMVGEKGPEMFVPRTSGTIVPNNALSSAGGSQVINNYNIQAIDVKSFEDRIMGSSTAVWAANAYANKSLAIGRGRA